jgi:hypothetical protein
MLGLGVATHNQRGIREIGYNPHSPDDILFFATLTAIQI